MRLQLEIELENGFDANDYKEFATDLNHIIYRMAMVDHIIDMELEGEQEFPDIDTLLRKEAVQQELDNAIIHIMDVMRDNTKLDINDENDGNDDDDIWGMVYQSVYDTAREAYAERLRRIALRKKATQCLPI